MQAVAGSSDKLQSTSWLATDLTAFTFTPPDWRTAVALAGRHSVHCELLGPAFSGGTLHSIAVLQRDWWQLGAQFPVPKEPTKRNPPSWLQRRSSMRKRGRPMGSSA